MIRRLNAKELQGEAFPCKRSKLSPAEKGMLRWAVLDPGDKVLDANTRDGLMLEYLYRNMECEICGLSSDMERVRQSRECLRGANVAYAEEHNIPWQQNFFDAVMLRKERGGDEA